MLKITRRIIAADRKQLGTRPGDRQALIDRNLAERQRNLAAHREVDGLARRGRRNRIAQRDVAIDNAAVRFVNKRVDRDRQQPAIFQRLEPQPATKRCRRRMRCPCTQPT